MIRLKPYLLKHWLLTLAFGEVILFSFILIKGQILEADLIPGLIIDFFISVVLSLPIYLCVWLIVWFFRKKTFLPEIHLALVLAIFFFLFFYGYVFTGNFNNDLLFLKGSSYAFASPIVTIKLINRFIKN